MEATVLYPPTQAADGIKLARLLAQGKSMADLVQVEVPRRIVLNAPVVTSDNVEEYRPMLPPTAPPRGGPAPRVVEQERPDENRNLRLW